MPERQRLFAAYMRRAAFKRNSSAGRIRRPEENARPAPHTLVISCYEGLSAAQNLFSSCADEVLHFSEIAALVPPYDSHRATDPYAMLAKLEYAVEVAGISHIVVMGDSSASGLGYLLEGTAHNALGTWVEIARMSLERARAAVGGECDHPERALREETLRQALLQSVRNLLTYPCVYKSIKRGQITLNAWYYDGTADELFAYNPDVQQFQPALTASIYEAETPEAPPAPADRKCKGRA